MELYKGILIGIVVGIVGVMFVMPILQEFATLITNILEIFSGYAMRNITKRNAEMQLIQAEVEDKLQPVGTSCMGFEVPNDGYVYGDECDDKECDCKKNQAIADRCPIGFE